jgi:cytochrome b6-f complex iron-sulfur subunit
MSDENKPQEPAAPKKPSSLAGLTGLKPAGGAKPVAPKPAAPASEEGAASAAPVTPAAPAPGAGVKPVAPGAGVKPAAPGAGIKPAAPGAGLKPAAPGAPVAKPAAPAGAAAPVAKAAVAKAAPAAAAKKEEAPVATEPNSVSRREFLNYVWGASIALFLAQFGGLTFFFAFPRFRPGQFGGKIPADISNLPELNKPPAANDVGKFWLVNTDAGVNVLYKICTHLGCIYPWSDAAGIFACPCHGSQFELNGKYIAGPAPRDLDKFAFEIQDANGAKLAESLEGQPIALPAGAATIVVDTGKKIDGKSHF